MDLVRVDQARGRPRTRPQALAGDKGYSYPRVRRWLAAHGMRTVIPMRSDQLPASGRTPGFDPVVYRDRNVVERCVGWLKECRRVLSRFEKLAVNYLAVVKIAMIERILKVGLSDRA